jgi:hypothetical protein
MRRDESFDSEAQSEKDIGCANSLLHLDVSNCEKPTGISRDCTK